MPCEYVTAPASLPAPPLQLPMPRKAWDDSSGLVALMKYATAEARASLEAGMLHTAASAYLAHAAAGALLRWVLHTPAYCNTCCQHFSKLLSTSRPLCVSSLTAAGTWKRMARGDCCLWLAAWW